VEALTRRRLVRPDVYGTLARISGGLLTAYVMLKAIDTLVWLNSTSRRSGFVPWEYYAWPPFGLWILFAEIVLFGFVPAVWLLRGDARQPNRLLLPALLACAGVGLNRFVLTIQTLALPTLPFDEFMTYAPSWQESAAFLGVIAFGVIAYSFSYRYLKLFPQERQGE
jgi:molybdopterin-containing oxidoreductase family membrane subunit